MRKWIIGLLVVAFLGVLGVWGPNGPVWLNEHRGMGSDRGGPVQVAEHRGMGS